MQNFTDDQLLDELKFRLEQSRRSLQDLSVVNRKLVDMNKKLEESETLKTNFLSNIRNEINNPLNAIIGLSLQMADIVKTQEVSKLVSMILSEAFNLDFQLRNIFIAAELEAGEALPNIEHVEVISVLTAVLENFSLHASDRQISLKSTLIGADEEGKIFFPTDSEKLQVIMANLLANAIEYSKPGTDVTVLLEKSDKQLLLKVEDQGIGIDESDLGRIFNRFVQLDTGPARAHLGHGLGLSVVKSLLDLLQGRVEVTSKPGIGSTFTVIIPAADYPSDKMIFAEGGNLFLFDEMEEK